MGRFSSSGSKNQRVRRIEFDHYRLSWTVDRYYKHSRLRHPISYQRDTDRKGAERFAKKWGLTLDDPHGVR